MTDKERRAMKRAETSNGIYRYAPGLESRCRYCQGGDIHLATCYWFSSR